MAEFSKKIPLVAVVGPTASGKTDIAIDIAMKFGGEIVSMDSMQIYKYMDIGTAKPDEDEMRGIPHHMLSCVLPGEAFTANDYVAKAKAIIKDIYKRAKLPVICGGTGLYLNSLLYNYNMSEAAFDNELRESLYKEAEANGNDALWEKLKTLDPKSAEEIHPNNLKRVVRALEICILTGRSRSEQLTKEPESDYDFVVIGMNREREYLYERINKRVDIMLQKGLEAEVKRLSDEGYLKRNGELTQAGEAIGYKEMLEYIEGRVSLEEAVERIKMNSRRYAKRQITWFKRTNEIMWTDPDKNEEVESAYNKIEELMRGYLKR